MKQQLADALIIVSVVEEVTGDPDIVFNTTHVFRLDVEMSKPEDVTEFVKHVSEYEHVQHVEVLAGK